MKKYLVVLLLIFVVSYAGSCGGGGGDSGSGSTWIGKLTADDSGDYDCFGYSVSISGDYAIVGAYNEDGSGTSRGAAYIYHKTGTDSRDAGIRITASDAADGDSFGYSVSISGDYAIVGAPMYRGSSTAEGAVYIFHRTGPNTWDSGTKITASDASMDNLFGSSVSISGDYAIIGAYQRNLNTGTAYIYQRTGINTWGAEAIIAASDPVTSDSFGFSVSISGDYAIVGACSKNSTAGAAYVFHRTSGNTWSAATKITASDAEAGDYYGVSVSISGNYAIVGAHGENGSGTDRGAGYIVRGSGTNTWTQVKKITVSDAADGDCYGCAVALSGDYAYLGSYNHDGHKGNVCVFNRDQGGSSNWGELTGRLSASGGASLDDFATSMGVSGDYIIVGAPAVSGGANQDAAYIMKR